MNNSSWESIQEILSKSNKEILYNSTNMVNTKVILDKLQIRGNSFLGAIIQNTSGVVIDNWIRLLGSDSKKNRGIVSYNLINEDGIAEKIDKMLIVADDIVGGVFALNAGRFSEGIGDVWYFAPDTLEWESLEMKYSEFIAWIAQGEIDEFYSTMRWSLWKEDSKSVNFNEAILIYPFLWSNEIQIEKADKKIVPVEELLDINQEYSKKFCLS